MDELQREHVEADALDYKIAEDHNNRDEYQCECCNEWFHESKLVRGLCPGCVPRCHEEFCDGLLMLQMADLAICDKCSTVHLLNENGDWIPKEEQR